MTSEEPVAHNANSQAVSEESLFFDLALDLLAIADLQGYFKRVNPAFTRTLGYSETELLSRPYIEFIHPSDRIATLTALAKSATGEPISYLENRYQTQAGTYLWLAWTASPRLESESIYCIARDITQQKRTEATLRASEERWQLALRGSNDGIWDWNVQTNEVFFSTHWKTMLGYEEHEISNHLDEWSKRVHPDDIAWVTQVIQDHLDQKTEFYISEHRVQCKDGSYKWILDRGRAIWDENGNVLRMVGSHSDITRRKTLETALQTAKETLEQRVAERTAELEQINRSLQESEVRFRTALDHIPDVFVIYDAERRIQFINAAGLRLTQRPLEDFLGHTDEEIHSPTVTNAYLPLLQQAITSKSPQTGECTITLPNCHPYTIIVHYVPLCNDQGDIQQVLGITHDITRHKQSEAAIRRSEQQVRRILDSLFSFVGVMTPDGILQEVNRTALDAAGISPEAVLGQDFAQTYWWSYAPETQNQLRAAIARAATGETVRYDAQIRVKNQQLLTIDFTIVPIFDETGRVEFLIPSGIDITERKQAEIALQESQAQVQRQLTEIETIYQSAPIGLNVLDPDLRFIRINQHLAEINGLPPADHIGRTVREILPDLADTAEALLRPVLQTGEPLLDVEIRGETPAQPGVQRVWLESFLPLKDGDRIVGINTVCEEITERKRVEQRLRESEERLRLGMQVTGFALVRINYPTNTVELSPEAATLYGFPPDQLTLTREQLHATFHPSDQPELMQLVEQVIDPNGSGSFARDHRIVWPNGEIRWLTVRKQVFFDRDSHQPIYAILVALDITERKQAEEQLRRSEERYRTLFKTMEDGFCIIEMLFDQQQTPIDYRFLEINPAFERLTGLQQAVGKTARELIPNLEPFWFETYGRVALTGEPIRFENGSDVMNRWFDVYAFAIGQPEQHRVALLFKEISDRKQAENTLRASEDRLRMAITSAQLGTWDWNLITNELTWDTACKAMFGLPPEAEMTIELFLAGLHPDDRDRLQTIVQTALNAASGGSYDTEYRTIGVADGVERWLRAKGQVYYNSNGQPLRFSGTILNITEQKQAEAQREQLLQQEQVAREAAERANQVKDEFLAVLSHELRTPLNPILGWAKLLQAPQIGVDQLTKGLTTIERNAKQLVQLIDDLLDISRIIRGKLTLNFTPMRLSEPIMAALETVRLAVEAKGLQIEVSFDSSVGQVQGDASRLQQVIWNLLSNAVKFTPTGGRITIQLTQSDRSAQIQVSDTGKGINPKFLPHVFELFRQQDSSTTRSFGGLGLGLAIARQVVEAHGGTIAAFSAGEGQGATFTVQLPLIPVTPLTPPNHLNLPASNLENLRVVAVDDEIDSLELVKVVLEQEGAAVQIALSATQALNMLAQESFDLLISDIGMPDVDGYDLIRQVRELSSPVNRGIPAIALTAYAGEANQRQILSAGFQTHLAKPIDPQALLDAIAAMIAP